jgi:hypothetical protein
VASSPGARRNSGRATALASPETAERIAVLEAATSGGLSALEAARLTVQRAGHDLRLLNGLTGLDGLDHARRHGEERTGSASPLPRLASLANADADAWANGANGARS